MRNLRKEIIGFVFAILLFLASSVSRELVAQTATSPQSTTTPQTSQSPQTQGGPGQGQAGQEEDRTPSATALGSIFFRSRNSFIFSLGAGESTTDNLYFTPLSYIQYANPGSTYQGYIPFTTLSGRAAYQRQTARTTFAFDYGATGMIFNQAKTNGNFLIQDGGLHVNYLISPRWTLRAGSRVSISPIAGRIYTPDLVLPTLPQGVQPNNTIILGYGRSIASTSDLSLAYQITRRSTFAATFYGNITRFSQIGTFNMNQPSVDARYSYQFSERTSLYWGYTFNYYDFESREGIPSTITATGSSIFRTHYPYIGVTRQITSMISGTVSTGPVFMVGTPIYYYGGQPGTNPGMRWGINGTITFSQPITLDPRTFVSINVGQNLNDGYGIGYLTLMDYAGGSLGRLLTRKLLLSFSGNYAHNRFLMNLAANGQPLSTDNIMAGSLLRFNTNEKLSFYAGYNFIQQISEGFNGFIPGNGRANTFSVGVSYAFPVFF